MLVQGAGQGGGLARVRETLPQGRRVGRRKVIPLGCHRSSPRGNMDSRADGHRATEQGMGWTGLELLFARLDLVENGSHRMDTECEKGLKIRR